jgi:hypothetical protein
MLNEAPLSAGVKRRIKSVAVGALDREGKTRLRMGPNIGAFPDEAYDIVIANR